MPNADADTKPRGPAMSATSPPPAPAAAHYLPVRQAWLDRLKEPIIEPALPIVDPHHHLWDRGGWRYLLDELLADTGSGHNIVATVFVQARSMYRETGPAEMRPVGETEFANGVADKSFREGFAVLGRLGLSFDAWLYHPQIDELAGLARAFPDIPIVLNHVGGAIGIGAYAGEHREE